MMQSVFLEIYRVAAQFEAAKGSTKVWLLQYAYHRSMNRREYLKVRGFYTRNQKDRTPSSSTGRPARDTTLQPLAYPELRCMVREAMESLNHSQQNVLHMAYFEDMPLRDIALSTGESLGNVRHHYYRALRRLRSLFSTGDAGRSGNVTRGAHFEIASRGSVDVET